MQIEKLSKKTFLEGIEAIEETMLKKFNNKQKEIYYKLLSDYEDEKFLKGIYEYLKNNTYPILPVPGEIRKYIENSKVDKIEILTNEIYYQIRKMTKDTTRGYVTDIPLTHLIIKKLGGLYRLGTMDSEELERLLNSRLRKMVEVYRNWERESIPLVIGDPNTNYITKIGNSEKIEYWTNKYKAKMLESNRKEIEN